MAVIGIAAYEARDGFFLFNGKFRGKYGALVIFLASLFVVSLITPLISSGWNQALPYIPPGQLLGAVIIFGMVGVNKAAEWNLLDIKSLVVYLLGIILVGNPELLHAVA